MGLMGEQTDGRNGGLRIRLGVRTAVNLLAIVAQMVAFVCVAVLLVRIGLAFVAVNPQNAIVRGIGGFADAVVLAFRDLFLPVDPRVRLAVNYGVAAIFWLIVGLVAARLLRGLGRLVAGRFS